MANELYTRTNQKLYFAGLALEAWQAAEAAQALNAQTQIQAARETALFHLYGALLGLCHEIAGYYRLPQAGAGRVEELLERAVLEAAPGPELAELVELAEDRHSWLVELLTAWRQLFEPPREARKAKVDPSVAVIVAVEVGGAQPAAPDLAMLGDWQRQIRALALRFRQGMSEW